MRRIVYAYFFFIKDLLTYLNPHMTKEGQNLQKMFLKEIIFVIKCSPIVKIGRKNVKKKMF